MPVHFNSIMKKEDEQKVLTSILSNNFNNPDGFFVTEDKSKSLIINNLVDKITNEIIGRTTLTFVTRNNAHEIVDIDITLNSDKTKLFFEEKYDESSDSNEYYHVSHNDDSHFEIETVGRYRVETDVENKEMEVSLSAFPFQLSIYDTIEDLDKELGFKEPIQTPVEDMKVCGFAENFMGVGSIFRSTDEPCSFIIGKIKSFSKVNVAFGEENVEFTVVHIDTGIGDLPVAVSEYNFDIKGIKEGMILAMFADVKAEF